MATGEIIQRPKSGLQDAFNPTRVYKEGHEFWSFLGQPMFYDGALFVVREPFDNAKDLYRWYITARMI